MGNKHGLAPHVVQLAAELPPRTPLIDVFCGLCSIGSAFARTRRQVWGNDIQGYAALAARCQLRAESGPRRSGELIAALQADYRRNTSALQGRFAEHLAIEDAVLSGSSAEAFVHYQAAWRHAGNDPTIAAEVRRLAETRTGPDRLCTLTFAWGYFGLRQAIEIDSVRHAVDRARAHRDLTRAHADWALLALLEAASVCASTSGHFAQFLGGTSDAGFARVRRQRRRAIWEHFLAAADSQGPFGTRAWRRGNAVFNEDALKLWPHLDQRHDGPAVVYADPPYSKDHYSRYYHVLETLVRYDYPDAVGAGRYRPDRFSTPFSLRRHAPRAFETLFERVAERQWTLILSYPGNGLLPQSHIDAGLRRHFRSVSVALRWATTHSTLGARHGAARNVAEELMWVAS